MRSVITIALFSAAFASATGAQAQSVELSCTNHESDDPVARSYTFDGKGSGSSFDSGAYAYAYNAPYVVMYASGNSEIIDMNTGFTGYAEGDARSWSAGQIAGSANLRKGKTCKPVSGAFASPTISHAVPSTGHAMHTTEQVAPTASKLSYAQPFTFSRGEKSDDGTHYLSLQNDGNFVVKTLNGDFVHGFNTFLPADKFTRIAVVKFQDDGNFAAYDANGGWIWSALDVQNPRGELTLQPDGDLVLSDAQGETVWAFSWKK